MASAGPQPLRGRGDPRSDLLGANESPLRQGFACRQSLARRFSRRPISDGAQVADGKGRGQTAAPQFLISDP